MRVGETCWLIVFGEVGGCFAARITAVATTVTVTPIGNDIPASLPTQVDGLQLNGSSVPLACLGGIEAAVIASSDSVPRMHQPVVHDVTIPAPHGWKWSDAHLKPCQIIGALRDQCAQLRDECVRTGKVPKERVNSWTASEPQVDHTELLSIKSRLLQQHPASPQTQRRGKAAARRGSSDYSMTELLDKELQLSAAQRTTLQLREAVDLATKLRDVSMVELDSERQRNAMLLQQHGPIQSQGACNPHSHLLERERDEARAKVGQLNQEISQLQKDVQVLTMLVQGDNASSLFR